MHGRNAVHFVYKFVEKSCISLGKTEYNNKLKFGNVTKSKGILASQLVERLHLSFLWRTGKTSLTGMSNYIFIGCLNLDSFRIRTKVAIVS